MTLNVLTPDKELFSGEVSGVQLPGINGKFEILNNHAPLISALEAGTVRITEKSGQTNIQIESGFVECLQNRIVVLVEGGTM